MNHRNGTVRRYTVYHGPGEPLSHACELPEPPSRVSELVSHAKATALTGIMTNELICARADLELGSVVDLMMRHHLGCLPVVDHRRRPIGVITKLDLVEQIGASMLANDGAGMPSDLRARNADDVMMPLVLSLPESASVADAARLMSLEDTHHVLVISGEGRLVGVVSAKDIVEWVVEQARACSVGLDAEKEVLSCPAP